jgi:hypothetical protein
MKLGRRSFLKGLVAATALSPLMAQPGPPRFLVATSRQGAVVQRPFFRPDRHAVWSGLDAGGVSITTQMSEYGEWITVRDIAPRINRGIFGGAFDAGRWGLVSTKVAYGAKVVTPAAVVLPFTPEHGVTATEAMEILKEPDS